MGLLDSESLSVPEAGDTYVFCSVVAFFVFVFPMVGMISESGFAVLSFYGCC